VVLQRRGTGCLKLDRTARNLSSGPRLHPAVDRLAHGRPQQILVQGQRVRPGEWREIQILHRSVGSAFYFERKIRI
jgi:hypothetical protein